MKWLFLFRAFFPSWRFFDDTGPELKLFVRSLSVHKEWLPWRDALPPIRRGWKSFPLNAQAGFLHACHNSLEHLALDLNGLSASAAQAEDLASYRVIRSMALFQLRQSNPGDVQAYQFKVLYSASDRSFEELLVSPQYPA